ncbi:MAG: DNA polymerase zeta, partial [Candelina submexicana]
MELFRLRLNCIDHYQAILSELDPQLRQNNGEAQGKHALKVPVIRVFGATQTGQKVCAHIHGALPYLFIEYGGSLIPDDVTAYIRRLHMSIDHALAISYRRNMYDGKTTFVALITLVKGIPFYGYHVGYKFFLKIYMLNPLHMTRLADLLRQGSIMKKPIQPYESHVQYLLQWMCDYNLYGCDYIDCAEVRFRGPIPDHSEINSDVHQWHDKSIPVELILDDDCFPRQSHCSLEVDICVQDILNRNEVKERPLHHDFIERQMPFTPNEKLVHSMAGLWKDETRRRKARMPEAAPGSTPFPPDVLISMSAEPRSSQRGGWIHEEEYMGRVKDIVQEEKNKSDGCKVRFEGFVKKAPFEGLVKTTLESVEDLYPENIWKLVLPEQATLGSKHSDPGSRIDIDVDESRIPRFENDETNQTFDENPDEEADRIVSRQGEHVEESHGEGGVPEARYDDETRPDGDAYAQQFFDPVDPPVTSGPNAPIELNALGVRDSSDVDNSEDDGFDIASDYASNVGVAKLRDRSRKEETVVAPDAQPPRKKQRISREGRHQASSRQDIPRKHFVIRADSVDSQSSAHSEVPMKASQTPTSSLEDRPSTASLPTLATQGPPFWDAKDSKQGSIKASALSTGMTLSFPVVKDPQDPHTVQRLSQRTSSSHKSTALGKGETFPLITPDESLPTPPTAVNSNNSSTMNCKPEISFQARQISEKLHLSFPKSHSGPIYCFWQSAPEATFVTSTLLPSGLPTVIYQDAYYSDEKDVPERPREYAGQEFKLESNTVPYLPAFNPMGTSCTNTGERMGMVVDRRKEEKAFSRRRRGCRLQSWEIQALPPSKTEVRSWLKKDITKASERIKGKIETRSTQLSKEERVTSSTYGVVSQIDGPTQKNKHGFKFSQKQKSTSVQHEAQYMSVMSLEIHVETRGNLLPNPNDDQVVCVFWCIQSDDEDFDSNVATSGTHLGILAVSEKDGVKRSISSQAAVDVEEEPSELDLINRMVDIVRHHDPDILTGYEVHGGSWGYLIERARTKYDYNLCDEFSRMKSQSHGRFGKENDKWGFNHTSTIRVTGRHMINIWRAMRGELNLLQYTMENVVFHLLHRRIPHYTYHDLTRWYNSGKPRDFAKVINYYVSRVQLDLEILEQNELIPRTSEQARLLGVDFFSVFSRGSQFKVESLMFRIAKPENFLLVSPSRKQVGQQNALECLPLVMEPQSAFYNSPLLVLDFQSLYPSVMIAYNYCYSTFLGRVVSWRGQNKMGFTDFKREQRLLELFNDSINIAPNGMMYVKPEIRKSLLAKMLGEILETRVMVKSGMKVDQDDKTLQRLLNNRQLALKLIANVTYGYTSASFSGRMPCSEIADSIVQTGRETLERAIALIHSVRKWGAEVVYGDTDSLFVYLKGRTKDEAFDIGEEIAKAVTNMNPRPVKLKFEKVYFPCVLLAKKRYVGFKYESRHQVEPDFDAKGIETVRRDGTPAEQKIEEKALKILFRTADLSQVKSYFQHQCTKIMKGKVSIQDFCFAKEVKLGTYSDKGLPPPGAMISTKRMLEDPRAEPQYGERVPYVVITGAPGARLIDRCVAPETLLHNDHSELDAEYYISKNLIPPLERIFNLVGANVRSWYDEMPKFQRIRRIENHLIGDGRELIISKKTLESYMKSSSCLVCGDKLEAELPICGNCLQHAETSLMALRWRLAKAEKKAVQLQK